jgi:hypothetical protein
MFQEKWLIFIIFMLICEYSLSNLVGIIQLNRHGARTGRNFSNLTSELFFGSGELELTINGFRQVEKLGQWIAERYIYYDYKLLSPDFDPEEILIKTSSKLRTIFSAAGFMKGMFPFSETLPVFLSHCKYEDKCNYLKDDDIPPIINYSRKRNLPNIKLTVADPDEDIIFHTESCRLLGNSTFTGNLKNYLIKTEIYNITKDEIIEAINEIKSKWEEPFTGLPDDVIYTKNFLNYLYAFISHTEYHFNNKFFALSNKTDLLMKKLNIEKWYNVRLSENWASRLINSPIYYNYLIHLDTFVNRKNEGTGKFKYLLLSAHDTNIVNMIAMIVAKEKLMEMIANYESFYDFLQPPYASSFIIELHSYNSKESCDFLNPKNCYFIRILYNGQILRDELRQELHYDHSIDGIDYKIFREFLFHKIDMNYRYLNCHR